MEYFGTFFSCTSVTVYGVLCRFLVVHSQCSFELCLVPFQIRIYPSIIFNVEGWNKVFLQLLLQLLTQTSSNLWTYKMLEDYFICFSFKEYFVTIFFLKNCLRKINYNCYVRTAFENQHVETWMKLSFVIF
jgi:hypothetical protein